MRLGYGFPTLIVITIIVLSKNTKVIVCSPDVTGVAPCMFRLCLDYVLRTTFDLIKENGFTRNKSYRV